MGAISRSRGCTIRFHPQGFRVIMYKDTPGEYLDEQGRPLTAKLAKEAGFDTDTLGKEKAKQTKLDKARERIEKEFATEMEKVEKELSGGDGERTVKHIGNGMYAIMDVDGTRMTQDPLNKDQAHALLKDLNAAGQGNDSGGQDHGT